ncbi:MAG: hypothetical protein NC400_07945 [Clostridium sp.]|nr:hypothetical protein [Clostridium sp.]
MKLRKIKSGIIKIIGYSNYRKIVVPIARKIKKVNSKIIYGSNISKVREFSIPGNDIFFGYYDIRSLDNSKNKLLSLAVDKEKAKVGYFDVNTAEFIQVAETHAWNWQMGTRLRWYEDGKSLLFNDYDGNNFISRIVDIDGIELKRFCFPIFDIDVCSGIGYFTDFTILHYLREGYGYSNKKVDFEEYYKNTQNGIFRFTLADNQYHMLLSIEELQNIEHVDDMVGKYHYINHITINPENGDVMFFHLWTDGKGASKSRMIFLNQNEEVIKIISDFDRASHYVWKDKEHLLASVYIGDRVEYRLYNYRTGKYILMDGIQTDGHPTYINKRFFITDTYPNRYAMQSIYLCDSKEQTYLNIFSIYHSPQKVEAERCDLHPRIIDNLINIDSVAESCRKQYLFEFKYDLHESVQWTRKIQWNTQADDSDN